MPRAIAVTRALLRRTPLPAPDASGDKESRGRVLVVGGSASNPGAVLLAGVAALRAGAGKLQLATVKSCSAALGVAVPESLVIGLTESAQGEIASGRVPALLRDQARTCDALLIGPGMSGPGGATHILHSLKRELAPTSALVLDAAGILALRQRPLAPKQLRERIVITPHAGEMATLLGVDIEEINSDPAAAALVAAQRHGVIAALKGSESWIAEPSGTLYRYTQGRVGLATSGSGDTLAGIVAGFIARGASPVSAAIWAVFVHGAAGHSLARRIGTIGYLARELLDEVPGATRKVTLTR